MSTPSLTLKKHFDRQQAGDAYIKFQLGSRVPALLPAVMVQEAIVLPAQRVTAMPNMPPCMMGLINRRSKVIWVANLMSLLGIPSPVMTGQQYSLVIIQVGTSILALGVDAIDGMVMFPADKVQPPPPHANPSLLPYLRGCVVQPEQALLLLDAEAILQSSIFQ